MTGRRLIIAAAVAVIAYQLWRMSRGEEKKGYCLGGIWIPPGAGKPFVRDGKMYYCPKGNDCDGDLVEVDIEKVDKRCL